MSDTDDLRAEDFRFTAKLLREHSRLDDPALFHAVTKHNLPIILAALQIAEAASADYEKDSAP